MLSIVKIKLSDIISAGGDSIANDNFSNNFKKGATALVILSLLQNKDMYGYQIAQVMKEKSGGDYSVPEGSLYPALYKLIEQGYISDEKRQVGKRLTRVYYHIEEPGREYLKQLKADYYTIKNAIERILELSEGDTRDDS